MMDGSIGPGGGMVRTMQGLLLVIGGAIAGAAVFGVLFGLMLALFNMPVAGAPLAERAVNFGLTFGLFTGTLLGIGGFAAIAEDDPLHQKALPFLLALLLLLFAAWLLFLGGAWTVIFRYLGNLSAPALVGWVLLTGGLMKAVPTSNTGK